MASKPVAGVGSTCTGQWENGPDANQTHCVGATACMQNQRCLSGQCLSEPYRPAAFCRTNFTCNGNQNFYNYTLMKNIPVITDYTNTSYRMYYCNNTISSACSLPRYCTTVSAECPDKENYATLIFAENGNLLFALDAFVSPPVALRLSPPTMWFQDALNQRLTTCTKCQAGKVWDVVASTCVNGTSGSCIPDRYSNRTLNNETATSLCGGAQYRYYLQVVELGNTGCPIQEPQMDADGIFWESGASVLTSIEAAVASNKMPTDASYIRAIVTMRPAVMHTEQTPAFVRVCSGLAKFDASPPVTADIAIVSSTYNVRMPDTTRMFGKIGAFGQVGFFSTGTALTVLLDTISGAGWQDPHTDIKLVQIRVTRTSDAQVLNMTTFVKDDVFLYSAVQVSFPLQTDGTQVSVQVTAINTANLSSSVSEKAILDLTPARFKGTFIRDCQGDETFDVDSVNYATTDSIQACLETDVFVDEVSDISHLESVLQFRTDANGWLDMVEPCKHWKESLRVVYNHSDDQCELLMPYACSSGLVCLEPRTFYRIGVRAVNGAGMASQWYYTNGITLDNTNPTTGSVYFKQVSADDFHGRKLTSRSVAFQSSSSDFWITWEGFADGEATKLFFAWEIGTIGEDEHFLPSVVVQEPIGWMSSNTSAFASGTATFINSPFASFEALSQPEKKKTGLSLVHGQTYHVRLTCWNQAALSVSVVSAGIKIDTTPPDVRAAYVKDVAEPDTSLDSDMVLRPERLCAEIVGQQDCDSSPEGDCMNGIEKYVWIFGHVFHPEGWLLADTMNETILNDHRMVCTDVLPYLSQFNGRKYFAAVRLCNRAGLCTTMTSDGIVVDFNPPLGYVQDSNKSADIMWQAEDHVLCASWANITDEETGIKSFEVAHGVCGTSFEARAVFLNVGLQRSYCFTGQELASRPLQRLTRYCVAVRSTNNVDYSSVIISDGVEISKPPLFGAVFDGPQGEEVDYIQQPAYAVWWHGFSRQGAPISHFYAQTFREDNKQLVHALCDKRTQSSCAANLSASVLPAGLKVFTQVCAVNVVDQVACNRSNGFVPDYDPPLPGKVVNGRLLSEHVAAQSDTQSVTATWEGFEDAHTPIESCTWSIGGYNDWEGALPKTNVGRATSAQASFLSLRHGLKLYITVACTNMAGLTSQSVSQAVLVHTQPPRLAHVTLTPSTLRKDGMVFASRSESVQVEWGIDAVSKGLQVVSMVAIGTTYGGQDVLAFGANSSSPFTLPQLPNNVYYISVLLRDQLDRTAYSADSTLLVDYSPPLAGRVQISGLQPKDKACVRHNEMMLNFSWSSFRDLESGISHYDVGVGQGLEADSIKAFESVGTSGNHTLSVSGFSAGVYVLSVRAWNMAGLFTIASSTFVIDTSGPERSGDIAVHHDTGNVLSGELVCHAQGTHLQFSWSSFSDAECPVVEYEYAIWNASEVWSDGDEGANVTFQPLGLRRTVTIATLSFRLGESYQILLRASNTAGLQTTVASRSILVSSSSVMFTVKHANLFVSDVADLAGHVTIKNTTGLIHSVRCSAGIQRYGKQITKLLPVDGPSHVLDAGHQYPTSISCGAQLPLRLPNTSLDGQDIYLTVTVLLCTGETTEVSSQAARIDMTPPTEGVVELSDAEQPTDSIAPRIHTVCGRSNHTLQVVWSKFRDRESGVVGYDVAVGVNKGDDSISPFQPVEMAQSYVVDTTGLEAGVYAVSVRAWNQAGLSSISSKEFRIDSSAPALPFKASKIRVRHSSWGQLPANAACQGPESVLEFSWDNFDDPECPVVSYGYAVWDAEVPWPEDGEHAFTSLGLNTSVSLATPSYDPGKSYLVAVRATNAAGLQAVAFSQPILISSSGPQFEVFHRLSWVSNVSELTGSILVRNTTGFLISLTCSSGLQQYGEQLTKSSHTPLQGEVMHPELEYNIPLSCAAPSWVSGRAVDGAQVYLSASAVFCTGQTFTEVSAEAYLDTSPPSGGFVRFMNEEGKRVDWHWSSSGVMLEWGGFVDKESGIVRCELQVMVRDSDADEANETTLYPFAECTPSSKGTPVSFNQSDDNSGEVQAVTATLRCSNEAGIWGYATSRLMLDATLPVTAPVTHVTQEGVRNVSCQHALDTLSAFWDTFADPESSMHGYEYRIIQNDGATVREWQNVGALTSATARGLDLAANTVYIVQVKGWNRAGLYSVSSSAGIVARPSKPHIMSVTNDAGDLQRVASDHRDLLLLYVSVSGYATRVVCGIGTSSHTSEAVSVHTRTGDYVTMMTDWNVTCNLSSLPLDSGHAYFIRVSAYACSELDAPSVFSFRALYDVSAPRAGFIRARKLLSENATTSPALSAYEVDNVTYVSSKDIVKVSWGGFADIEDGIASYDVSLLACTAIELADCSMQAALASLNSSDDSLNVEIHALSLRPHAAYALQVEAIDGAGHRSGRRLGLVLDDTPPTPGHVINTEDDATALETACLSRVLALYAAWGAFSDGESPIVAYEWSAGREPYGTDLVTWTPVDAHVTHAVAELAEGSRLSVGDSVYVTVRVRALCCKCIF